MARYPEAIEHIISSFTRLPGVGRKTAERYVFFLLKQPPQVLRNFSANLLAAEQSVVHCSRCYNISTQPMCEICRDQQRSSALVCVVADSSTIFSIEQTNTYRGVYHVLGGTINQLDGIGPDQLHIKELRQRISAEGINEVILGLNPDVAGEATTLYIMEALKDTPVNISRLARGLPAGADIEYADDITLSAAIQDRQTIERTK